MRQTKDEIEKFYEKRDPWEYETTEDDQFRRSHILYVASLSAPQKILEIGAGEGFITKGLAKICPKIDVIEISDEAASRIPPAFERVSAPRGKYDMVVAAGVLYDHYDWEQMHKWIDMAAPDAILTCHYDKVGEAHDTFDKELTFWAKFPYREGFQELKVWR